MTTPRKPGATVDTIHLARAIDANQEMCQIVGRIADNVARTGLAGDFMRLSTLLGQQALSLAEMKLIRGQARNGNGE